jgi:hypothetical protein
MDDHERQTKGKEKKNHKTCAADRSPVTPGGGCRFDEKPNPRPTLPIETNVTDENEAVGVPGSVKLKYTAQHVQYE